MLNRTKKHTFDYELSHNPYVLAPMAGITDKAMRLVCRDFGAGLQFSEMVSAKALTYGNEKSLKLMDLDGEHAPVAVQIFGAEPEVMAEGARIAVYHGAPALDINMGCPVPKVAGNREGAALLKDPTRARAIVQAVSEAVSVPVSVKMRIGWDDADPAITDFAQGLEAAGASLITVHGRTRSQYYSGEADWERIAEVVSAVSIPVIANGDVFTPADAGRLLQVSGAAAVMIGRGALGRPWLFSQCLNPKRQEEPGFHERAGIIHRHAQLLVRFDGEHIGMQKMRKHFAWYIKGCPNAARWRNEGMMLESLQGLEALLHRMAAAYSY